MKRRGFLGFMGGAAAAGPTLGRSLAADAVMSRNALSQRAYASTTAGGLIGGDWKLDRIAELKAMIAGKPEDETERRSRALYSIEARDRVSIDALRSVAPHYRVAMFQSRDRHRQNEIMKIHWMRELEDLLRK